MDYKFVFNFKYFDFFIFRDKLLSCGLEVNVLYFIHIFLFDDNNISAIIPFKFYNPNDYD